MSVDNINSGHNLQPSSESAPPPIPGGRPATPPKRPTVGVFDWPEVIGLAKNAVLHPEGKLEGKIADLLENADPDADTDALLHKIIVLKNGKAPLPRDFVMTRDLQVRLGKDAFSEIFGIDLRGRQHGKNARIKEVADSMRACFKDFLAKCEDFDNLTPKKRAGLFADSYGEAKALVKQFDRLKLRGSQATEFRRVLDSQLKIMRSIAEYPALFATVDQQEINLEQYVTSPLFSYLGVAKREIEKIKNHYSDLPTLSVNEQAEFLEKLRAVYAALKREIIADKSRDLKPTADASSTLIAAIDREMDVIADAAHGLMRADAERLRTIDECVQFIQETKTANLAEIGKQKELLAGYKLELKQYPWNKAKIEKRMATAKAVVGDCSQNVKRLERMREAFALDVDWGSLGNRRLADEVRWFRDYYSQHDDDGYWKFFENDPDNDWRGKFRQFAVAMEKHLASAREVNPLAVLKAARQGVGADVMLRLWEENIPLAALSKKNMTDLTADKDRVHLGKGGFNSVDLVKFVIPPDGKGGKATEELRVIKPVKDATAGLGMASAAIWTGVDKGTGAAARNIASGLIAKALGMKRFLPTPDLVFNQNDLGIAMKKGEGVTGRELALSGTVLKNRNSFVNLARELNKLEWLDCLTAQCDRHWNNFLVDVRSDGSVAVAAIDNDISFGRFYKRIGLLEGTKTHPRQKVDFLANLGSQGGKPSEFRPSVPKLCWGDGGMHQIGYPALIDKQIHDSILSLTMDSEEVKAMAELLDEEELEAFESRLLDLQAYARELGKNGLVVDNWHDWRLDRDVEPPSAKRLNYSISVKKGKTVEEYLNSCGSASMLCRYFVDTPKLTYEYRARKEPDPEEKKKYLNRAAEFDLYFRKLAKA